MVPTVIEQISALRITKDLLEALVKFLFALLQLFCQGFPCIEYQCAEPHAPLDNSVRFGIYGRVCVHDTILRLVSLIAV
jgi:hypothetical protein